MDVQLVVGWDGSASARRALEWALAQPAGPVLLVQVVDGLDPITGPGTEDPRANALQTAVAEARSTHPGTLVESRFITGDPVVQLTKLSGPDVLLVVGDRERTALRLLAGRSVGTRLAAIAAGPVAIIPRGDAGGSGVVVGVDDSDSARAALGFAADRAASAGEELHIVHAWHVPFLWHDGGMPPAEFIAEVAAQHADILANAVAEARRLHPGLTVVGSAVDGIASRALLDASAGRSLLVVGDRRLSGMQRLLLGSVAHDILVDVLIPTVVVGASAVPASALVQHLDGAAGVTMTESVPNVAPPTARTIVAWDGSIPARSALEWAVDRERHDRRAVEIVMVADEAAASPDSAAAASDVEFDERAVARLLDQVRPSAPEVPLSARVVRGFVLRTLAELTRPDTLLIIGTEDRTGPRLRFDLSVGAHLPALARGPVAIIPRTVDPTLRGVAVGVDGSESSNAAVLVAAAEAERRSETLHLVHAWVEPSLYQSTFLLDADFIDALEEEHRGILDDAELFARTSHPALRIETHLVFGDAARALAGLTPRVGLIVVGSRRLGGWRRMLLGSVSHELVLNLDVPLIIVGHAEAPRYTPAPESTAESTGMQEEAYV